MRLPFSLSAWRQFDWLLIILVSALLAVSFASIYSIDLSRGSTLVDFPTQAVAAALGFGLLLLAGSLHVTVYQSLARFIYLAALILLAGVLFFGVNVRGTTGWFRVAGFSFQPAEFAKIALVLFLSLYIDRQGRRFDRPAYLIGGALFTFLPVGLILLQPDLGSALVLIAIWFGLLCLTRTKKRYIALVAALGIAASVAAWFFLFEGYQKDRILSFVHQDDPACAEAECYNVRQSLIAIGSGRVFGRGLGFGSQSQLHFLPEAQTDFILSVIAEELGFVGVCLVLLLYIGILSRLIRIARLTTNDFGAYTAISVALLFFIQITFNLGAATGLLPVTGLTLPFLSAGGSSLIVNCLLIGIVESVARSLPRTVDLQSS